MLTRFDNYLNYTDVLEESRIVNYIEDLYEDAHDSAEGTNTYDLNKEKVEVLNGINVAYIIEQYNLGSE